MTGRRLFRKLGRRGSSERKCCGYWGSKGNIHGSLTSFTRPWSKLSYYTGCICGSWCPGWSGPSGSSTTGWRIRLRGHSHGNNQTGGGSTHPWRRLCRIWGWRLFRPTSLTIRKPFTTILQLVQYWSYVWRWSGARGCGYQSNGDNRMKWTGREHGRRIWQRTWREKR